MPDGSACQQQPDTAAPEQIAFQTHDGKIRGPHPRIVARLHVDEAQGVASDAPRQTGAANDRDLMSVIEPDSPAVKQNRYVAVRCRKPARRRPAERKGALILQKEIALFREEEAEACQVDLLLVGLDLCEVGVVGEVCREVLRHPILHVKAGIPAEIVRHGGRAIGREIGNRVRLDLERPGSGWRLHPDQRRAHRSLVQRRLPSRGWNARDERDLVLPSVGAKGVEAPDLRAARLIAERLERNGRFDGPPPLEAPGLHLPDRVPVAIPLPLVRHLSVLSCAQSIHDKVERVAAILKGVEAHRHDVVPLPHVRTVAAHIVGDESIRFTLPAAERDVDIVLVECHPHFGLLSRRLTLLRLLLNEVRNRRYGAVERLIEGAVNPDGCRRSDRANGGTAGHVAGDDGRRDWWCRSVERSILTGVNDRGDDQCQASGQKPDYDVSHAVQNDFYHYREESLGV